MVIFVFLLLHFCVFLLSIDDKLFCFNFSNPIIQLLTIAVEKRDFFFTVREAICQKKFVPLQILND